MHRGTADRLRDRGRELEQQHLQLTQEIERLPKDVRDVGLERRLDELRREIKENKTAERERVERHKDALSDLNRRKNEHADARRGHKG